MSINKILKKLLIDEEITQGELASKIETEVLKILNQIEFLEKEQTIEEIFQNREKNSAATPQMIKNALNGCIAKGFAAPTGDGNFKITEEGKKQI